MIFLGDIAVPGQSWINIKNMYDTLPFQGKSIIANLEGPICVERDEQKYIHEKILFNGESVPAHLKEMNVKAVSLANNHIFDIENSFEYTQKKLSGSEIQFFGAGKNLEEASAPCLLSIDGNKIAFLAFGWSAIQCKQAKPYRKGVNPLRYNHVIESIKKVRRIYPDHKLVILMHWNYELEHFPQPADRELSRLCIDHGADAVIGGHSHIAHGIESYKGAPIVYSLGNWFIPHNLFFNGKLRFPEKTSKQLAFEWEPGNEPICHWFQYHSDTHRIEHLESEFLSKSEIAKSLMPYGGLSQKEYVNWFKSHRIKKLLLPIFVYSDNKFIHTMKVLWVKLRGGIIDFLLNTGLKKIRRGV